MLHLIANKKGSPEDSDDLGLRLAALAHPLALPELLRCLASLVLPGAGSCVGDVLVAGHLLCLPLSWWQGGDIAWDWSGGCRSRERLPLLLFLGSGLVGLAVLPSSPALLVLFERG